MSTTSPRRVASQLPYGRARLEASLSRLNDTDLHSLAEILEKWIDSDVATLSPFTLAAATQRFTPREFKAGSVSRPPVDRIADIRDWDPDEGVAGSDLVMLPPGRIADASLQSCFEARRSRRDFSGRPLTADEFASMLVSALGVTGKQTSYNIRDFPTRSFPSAGGLQSSKVYLYLRNVEGLAEGTYQYFPRAHALGRIDACDVGWKIAQACPGAPWARFAPCLLVIAGCGPKLEWKYHDLTFRLLHLDAGILVEAFYLVAAALGLNACALASIDEESIGYDLRLDMASHVVCSAIAVGASVHQ